MLFKNKTAIISGATRGIGKAIALELAREGANISFNFLRSEREARALQEELQHIGVKARFYQVDVRDYTAVKSWVDNTKEFFGGIDILVINAGMIKDKALALMDPDDWHDVLNTNLDGMFNLARSVIVTFMKQKGGVIVNMASVSGLTGIPRQTNYSASKAGMIGFTRSLAKEVGPYSIRVNAVAPGLIDTDMLKNLKEDYLIQLKKQIPLGRLGSAGEVARLVKFLVSDDGEYITGQTFVIDGGLSTI